MQEGRARKHIVTALGAAMYALLAGFGHQAERLGTAGESEPLRALLVAAALFVPAYALLAWLLRRGECGVERVQRKTEFHAGRAFLMILACYMPMLLITFPGSFAYDVPFQLEQVFTGKYSSHHPLAHTLLLGGLVKLGHHIGNINLGAALYTAIQMAALAACFALTCASISRQSGARAARWAAAFFALYPLHMMMAVNATKDVLFSGLFVLTLALVREALLVERPGVKLAAGIALCGAGMLLLRNNALYAMAVWLVLLLAMHRRRALRVAAVSLVAVVLCMGANNAMKAATGAAEGDLCEMLSWPIQQLARARNLHGDQLTQEEKQAVDELMPKESWRLYDPTISDPVKFEFDTKAFLSDPGKYAKVYLSVAKKCPKAYWDALLVHTYSFWYPYQRYGVSGYYLQMGISDQFYDWCDFERISSQSLMPRVLASLSWRFGAQGAMQIPGIGILFNMGVIVWVMLYFVIRDAYMGRWKAFACALLPVLLWGTFLLGPVMAGRYVYPFVCCLPVMASYAKHGNTRNKMDEDGHGE
ncbi:MAG: hypothetical protein IKK34_07740 [Clostridia bacterium]|nr:hypothetical protein [Clostridia bacterium]